MIPVVHSSDKPATGSTSAWLSSNSAYSARPLLLLLLLVLGLPSTLLYMAFSCNRQAVAKAACCFSRCPSKADSSLLRSRVYLAKYKKDK